MATILETLVHTLIQRFSDAGFLVPQVMTEKARELFVFYALDHCAIVPLDKLNRLLDVACQMVHKWGEIDPYVGMRQLAVAVQETTRCIAGEPLNEKVLIICKGGLVQEVVGLAIDAYEICDCEVFEGPDGREAEEYFDGLSDIMKKYLRTTGWNKELPRSRRESRNFL